MCIVQMLDFDISGNVTCMLKVWRRLTQKPVMAFTPDTAYSKNFHNFICKVFKCSHPHLMYLR